MRPPTRACIERLPDPRLPEGRGCPNLAVTGEARCADHLHLTPRQNQSAWSKARKAALVRDRYRCQVCGLTQAQAKAQGRGLEIHHLTGSHSTPGRSLHRKEHPLEELQTLCHECHRKTMRKETRPTYAAYAAKLRSPTRPGES